MMSRPAGRVVVAGGGPGGLPAAVAAAWMGCDVTLVERYGFLGGMGTAGLVHPWMGVFSGERRIVGGIFQEIEEQLKARGAWKDGSHFGKRHHCFDPEILKDVLMQLALEAGVKLLLHTFVVDAIVRDGRVVGVVCESKSGRENIEADVVIDATGDADVCARAGADYVVGRASDGLTQPATLHFRMGNVDTERMPSREEINEIYAQAKAQGRITNPRENLLWFDTTRPDVIHFNTTRVTHVDCTDCDDLTRAEIQSRQQVIELAGFIIERVPGFEHAYLLAVAPQVGVRETRHVVGEHTLTEDDVLGCSKPEDRIALGCWDVDIHNPAGEGTTIKQLPPGEYYGIPWRCLVLKTLDGLLVSGRPISATHEASSSSRIQATCYAVGHAAGVGAFLAARDTKAPRDVDVAELQMTLQEQGAIL